MPSSRIKVLNFIPHFGIGGTERQFLYLTKGLNRSRFDVRVGCMHRWGSFLRDIEMLGLPISEYKTKSLYGYKTMCGQFKLARDIRRHGVQLVHAYGFYANVFAIPAAMLTQRCVRIVSVRDMGAFPDREQFRILTLRVACRWADCVLANSYAVRGWLIKQGVRATAIQVIPNGIEIPARRDPADGFPIRSEFNVARDVPVIAMVGRLIRSKGVEFFLEALSAVAARFPSACFLIVGDACAEPSYKTELEHRARTLHLGNRVIFTGGRTDVPKLLGESTMSVLPTLSESLSNSLLEAMAAGLPVVATNVGGNPELISDDVNGILVPPRDPQALARAMIRILESPDLARQLGEAARDKVIKHFSIETTVRKTEELYMTLLERRGLIPRRSESVMNAARVA